MGRKRRTKDKLVWHGNNTWPERFVFEKVVHPIDGVFYLLHIEDEDDMIVARQLDLIVTAETPAKAKALAQRIADWTDGVYPMPERSE